MIHLPRPCRGRTAVQFPAKSSDMCCVELALDRMLCTHLGCKGFLRLGVCPFINPIALPLWCSWVSVKAKRLCVAATARVIWLCACVRYWPCRGLVHVFPLLSVGTIFKVIFANAMELSSNYFSSVTVFHDISSQIQKRARIGKIFARWHLVIAITSHYFYCFCCYYYYYL